MTDKITVTAPALAESVRGGEGAVEGRTPVPSTAPTYLITADASKVSGRDFLDLVTGNTPAEREAARELDRQRCIRAIERGDTFGFPPMMVDECRHIMAMKAEVRL